MNQPTVSDLPTTVERLRRAAIELFAERGYDGSSMAAIAERVGIAKASLYNYYASKDELLLDLVRRALAAWDEATTGVLDESGPLEPRARRYFEAVVGFVHREPDTASILHLATSLISGGVRERVFELLAAHRTQIFTRARRNLEVAIAAGELAAADPEDLLVFAEIVMNGLILSHGACPQLAAPAEERLPQLWRLYWRGLSGRWPADEPAP